MNFQLGNLERVDTVGSVGLTRSDTLRLFDVRQFSGKSGVSLHSGLPLRWNNSVPDATVSTNRLNLHLAAKVAFDRLLALAAIAALAPLFIIVAFAIKLESPGPVFFVQAREGRGRKPFKAFKFRSMRADQCDPTGVAQTKAADSRVTRVGAFLRKTSIDELPQLLNVLFGDMSIVGPRPHVANMLAADRPYDVLVPYYDMRYAMLPGITGWAQCNSLRGPTVSEKLAVERINHDIAYIQNYSFWLDLRIILLTLKNEFLRGSGH